MIILSFDFVYFESFFRVRKVKFLSYDYWTSFENYCEQLKENFLIEIFHRGSKILLYILLFVFV